MRILQRVALKSFSHHFSRGTFIQTNGTNRQIKLTQTRKLKVGWDLKKGDRCVIYAEFTKNICGVGDKLYFILTV